MAGLIPGVLLTCLFSLQGLLLCSRMIPATLDVTSIQEGELRGKCPASTVRGIREQSACQLRPQVSAGQSATWERG